MTSDHLLVSHDILHDQVFVFLSDGLVQFLLVLADQVLNVDVMHHLLLSLALHLYRVLRLVRRLLVGHLVLRKLAPSLFLILLLFQVSIHILSCVDLVVTVGTRCNQLLGLLRSLFDLLILNLRLL